MNELESNKFERILKLQRLSSWKIGKYTNLSFRLFIFIFLFFFYWQPLINWRQKFIRFHIFDLTFKYYEEEKKILPNLKQRPFLFWIQKYIVICWISFIRPMLPLTTNHIIPLREVQSRRKKIANKKHLQNQLREHERALVHSLFSFFFLCFFGLDSEIHILELDVDAVKGTFVLRIKILIRIRIYYSFRENIHEQINFQSRSVKTFFFSNSHIWIQIAIIFLPSIETGKHIASVTL